MKLYFFSIILTAFAVFNSCEQSQEQVIEAINYEASSRGFYLNITLTGDRIMVGNRMGSEESTIPEGDSQLAFIRSEIAKIDLKSIPDFKAPSHESYRDAAASAYFSVKTKENTYESESFDHGNPPIEIAPIIEALLKLAKVE